MCINFALLATYYSKYSKSTIFVYEQMCLLVCMSLGVHSFGSVSIVQLFAKTLKIKAAVSWLLFKGKLSNGREPQIILWGKKSLGN